MRIGAVLSPISSFASDQAKSTPPAPNTLHVICNLSTGSLVLPSPGTSCTSFSQTSTINKLLLPPTCQTTTSGRSVATAASSANTSAALAANDVETTKSTTSQSSKEPNQRQPKAQNKTQTSSAETTPESLCVSTESQRIL